MIPKKRIAILGSTGSIGRNTLIVAERLGFEVYALAAWGGQKESFDAQVAQYRPQKEVLVSRDGAQALNDLCEDPLVDIVVVAISGAAALEPTLIAARAKKRIALATKEVLVAAGDLLMRTVKESGAELIPVDSEHSAIFQCLVGEAPPERLILTASGGPFLRYSERQLDEVTVAQALAHPNWSMGSKITVDSSTLMNKGLEVIEAYHLYNIAQIDVVVHPQSIVHSMVEFSDGSIKAQLSKPDMKLPIQYALTYPERASRCLDPIDWTKAQSWEFSPPDVRRFPCLQLAYEALREGGSLPCFMNAANESLVGQFLKGQIKWRDIATCLERLMAKHQKIQNPDLPILLEIDREARCLAENRL